MVWLGSVNPLLVHYVHLPLPELRGKIKSCAVDFWISIVGVLSDTLSLCLPIRFAHFPVAGFQRASPAQMLEREMRCAQS